MMIRINGHDFKQDTVEAVGKFAILWNLFENNKCDNNCEPNKLIQIGSKLDTSEAFQLFANALKDRAVVFNVDDFEYVQNHLSMGNGLRQEYKELVRSFMNSGGIDNIAGGLLAIYRIRNNMFHGLKEWLDLDNQINLFVSMNEVLEEIL